MYKDKQRFIISMVTLLIVSISAYEIIPEIAYFIVTLEFSGWIMSALYLSLFIPGYYLISKSLYSYVIKKRIDKKIYLGYYFLIINFAYKNIEFDTFPLLDISIDFTLYQGYSIGINFTILIFIIFFKYLYENAPDVFSYNYLRPEDKILES